MPCGSVARWRRRVCPPWGEVRNTTSEIKELGGWVCIWDFVSCVKNMTALPTIEIGKREARHPRRPPPPLCTSVYAVTLLRFPARWHASQRTAKISHVLWRCYNDHHHAHAAPAPTEGGTWYKPPPATMTKISHRTASAPSLHLMLWGRAWVDLQVVVPRLPSRRRGAAPRCHLCCLLPQRFLRGNLTNMRR